MLKFQRAVRGHDVSHGMRAMMDEAMLCGVLRAIDECGVDVQNAVWWNYDGREAGVSAAEVREWYKAHCSRDPARKGEEE